MSVISTKNPALIEVDKDFRRYTSNPEMRKLEHRRMSYNLAHRIEMGEVMEMLKKAEESVAKSKAEIAKGKAEGIASLLVRRFGVVPSRITNSLYKIGNLEELDELFDFALDCQTLEEFEAKLR